MEIKCFVEFCQILRILKYFLKFPEPNKCGIIQSINSFASLPPSSETARGDSSGFLVARHSGRRSGLRGFTPPGPQAASRTLRICPSRLTMRPGCTDGGRVSTSPSRRRRSIPSRVVRSRRRGLRWCFSRSTMEVSRERGEDLGC